MTAAMDSQGFQCLHETKAGKEHPETAPLDPYSTPSGHGRLNLEEKLRLMLQKVWMSAQTSDDLLTDRQTDRQQEL